MKIVALAGGVGGAKLADGLAQLSSGADLTVIVNTGDDFEYLGLKICPDLDTVFYTLAGIANPATGWGRAEESWRALETVELLGGPTWFRLGDLDLGLHLERSRRLRIGETLSQITSDFCRALGIGAQIFPMTDDVVPTRVYTNEGEMPFQEYFVHRQCHPSVSGFRFENVEDAQPAPGLLDALNEADLVIFCPSNPWVSLDPILAVPGIRDVVSSKDRIVAVSPIIGGKAVKGPAAKMYTELGIQPSALSVARHYADLLNGFIMDKIDARLHESIIDLGIETCLTNTLMMTQEDRYRLAEEVVNFGMIL